MKILTVKLNEEGSLIATTHGFTFIEILGIAEFLRDYGHKVKIQEPDEEKSQKSNKVVTDSNEVVTK
jgi:hypothetical protein